MQISRADVCRLIILSLGFITMGRIQAALAIDPPEDRVETVYNLFSGGGITVHGPAMIVQKSLKGNFAIEAGARVDMISSASIDVVTQASAYSEERQENHIGISHIFQETLIQSAYTLSDEPDYRSKHLSVALAHDLLEGKLTVELRFARSKDQVGQNSDPAFGEKHLNHQSYAIGLTRLLSPRALVQINYELSTDQGQLGNPYRSVLIKDSDALVPEHYPDARTGQAWMIRAAFARPGKNVEKQLKGSIQFNYRYYKDTFGIQAHNGKIHYQHHFSRKWRGGLYYRYYTQSAATFYGNRHSLNQSLRARDKELSTFTDQSIGGSIRFEPNQKHWGPLANPYFKMAYRLIFFDYADFADPRDGSPYSWEANVIQASFGFNY